MLPIPLPMKTRASNAALAKARAMYGRRLTAADYKRLAACRTMPALAAELKALPMYEEALKTVNPPTARRAQLEAFLRQAIFDRYDSLCRYELSSGHLLYGYFTTSCEVDEILSCLRCLDAGRPGDYLYKLPDFLQQRCSVDLYALARVTDAKSLLAALAGTPYQKMLAPLADLPEGSKLLVHAEPYLENWRHKALVSLAPEAAARSAPGAEPGVRDYIALECDAAALSNAARLTRMKAPPAAIDAVARRDCTNLSDVEWNALLGAKDIDAFYAVLEKTRYGRALHRYQYSVLKEGLQMYRYDWCEKWLRFSTDPSLVMLCYVYLARCEVLNLDHIIEGVHYQMPADELLSMLVGCKAENDKGRVN